TRPRSPPGISPAKKFNPVNATSAFETAETNFSTAASEGTAMSKGHQNSMASNPADRATSGLRNSGNSVNNMDRLTLYRRLCRVPDCSAMNSTPFHSVASSLVFHLAEFIFRITTIVGELRLVNGTTGRVLECLSVLNYSTMDNP